MMTPQPNFRFPYNKARLDYLLANLPTADQSTPELSNQVDRGWDEAIKIGEHQALNRDIETGALLIYSGSGHYSFAFSDWDESEKQEVIEGQHRLYANQTDLVDAIYESKEISDDRGDSVY